MKRANFVFERKTVSVFRGQNGAVEQQTPRRSHLPNDVDRLVPAVVAIMAVVSAAVVPSASAKSMLHAPPLPPSPLLPWWASAGVSSSGVDERLCDSNTVAAAAAAATSGIYAHTPTVRVLVVFFFHFFFLNFLFFRFSV